MIFITACAGMSDCHLLNKGESIGWYQHGACATVKSYYQGKGRYTTISTTTNIVQKGEAGDIIFYINQYGGNHVDILCSTDGSSSAVVVGGNLSNKVKKSKFIFSPHLL